VAGDGTHTVSYFATDNAGNASTIATQPVKIDTVLPNAPSITFPANNGVFAAPAWTGAITGTATDTAGGSGVALTQLTIRSAGGQYWNGAAFAGATTWLTAAGTANWSYPFARPPDGTYTVSARTTDVAGNAGGAATSTATVDTVAPAVTIANPITPSTNATPTLTGGYGFAGGDSATVTVQVFNGAAPMGAALTAALNAVTHTWSVTVPALAPGTYTARASQLDGAGNTGLATTAAFTVTPVLPNAPVITNPGNNSTISVGAWSGAITGSASETGGSGVQYTEITIKSNSGPTSGQYYDGNFGFTAAVTWLRTGGGAAWTYSVPAQPGTYTVSARTVDNNGGVGPVTTSSVTITP
jgi:hypothetical protein